MAVMAVPATKRLPTSLARHNPSSRAADARAGSMSVSASPSANRAMARAVGLAAAEAGVADRVSFVVGDAARLAPEAPFDLVTIFEALHDMGDPVRALRAARERLADGGSVLVADERVADTFTAPGDATERLMYGWSILHCLPATLAEDPVEATGTVLRAPTLARWAAAAGFTDFEVLAIDNPFWRFYRLRG
jgi:SAM-dependent methyltransferase